MEFITNSPAETEAVGAALGQRLQPGTVLAYRGDRGGADVLKSRRIPCDIVQAAHPWELWDVDTPEAMARVRAIYRAGHL